MRPTILQRCNMYRLESLWIEPDVQHWRRPPNSRRFPTVRTLLSPSMCSTSQVESRVSCACIHAEARERTRTCGTVWDQRWETGYLRLSNTLSLQSHHFIACRGPVKGIKCLNIWKSCASHNSLTRQRSHLTNIRCFDTVCVDMHIWQIGRNDPSGKFVYLKLYSQKCKHSNAYLC